ncbi:MAG: cation transporter [Rikenellaceae bacterium]|nr:cation transporter [Rikenellaceae bacterium]
MNNSRQREIYRVTIVGSVVNLLLLIFKFVAGIVGHSAAMVADSVHSLSDFVTDIVVILFVRLSGRPADEDHDYGHGKFETLATLFVSLVLLGVAVMLFVNGVVDIVSALHGEVLETPGLVALIAAAASIVIKEILYRYTVRCGKKVNSQVVVANAWHHRSDALSSIGVLVGVAGAMLLGGSWSILDPIAATIVSVFIAKVAYNLLMPSLEELLERSLPKEVEQRILDIILSVDGVSSPHHLRTRRIGNAYAIEVHIRMDGNLTLTQAHAVTTAVERLLKQEFGDSTHVGIHTEPVK